MGKQDCLNCKFNISKCDVCFAILCNTLEDYIDDEIKKIDNADEDINERINASNTINKVLRKLQEYQNKIIAKGISKNE